MTIQKYTARLSRCWFLLRHCLAKSRGVYLGGKRYNLLNLTGEKESLPLKYLPVLLFHLSMQKQHLQVKWVYMIAGILAVLCISPSQACTVWGALTESRTLIAKNRDFYPGNQKCMTVTNARYAFFGLYGDTQYDKKYTLKMGVNQTGLVVFMTFASTIPRNQRVAKIPYYTVMENILGNYRSVDAVYKDSEVLFKESTPINYIFADSTKSMVCEIGLKNAYQCKMYTYAKRTDTSPVITFAQTNHYVFSEMKKYNLTSFVHQQTSYMRFNKINELMRRNVSRLSLEKYVAFSFNTEAKNDNPSAEFDSGYKNTYQDNSIFRTFNGHPDRRNPKQPNSDQGVSTMIVELPKNTEEPIKLYVRMVNGITDMQDAAFTQRIHYTEATALLDTAIKNPSAIRYVKKSCLRNIHSKLCR